MLKKVIAVVLICGLFLTTDVMVKTFAQTPQRSAINRETNFTVNKRATLSEIFGKENSATEKTFTTADAEKLEQKSLGQTVKRNNFSTAAKVGIGVGIAAVVIVAIVLATRGNDKTPTRIVQCIRAPCP